MLVVSSYLFQSLSLQSRDGFMFINQNPLRVTTSHETPSLFSKAFVSPHKSKRENPSLTSIKISMSEL